MRKNIFEDQVDQHNRDLEELESIPILFCIFIANKKRKEN